MKDPSPSSSRPNLTRWPLIAAGAGIVLIIAFAVLLNRSLPPSTVVIATDLEGGIYSQIARHYQEIFARHGVRLELLATNGSVENVKHLLDPRAGVSVALVQGGVPVRRKRRSWSRSARCSTSRSGYSRAFRDRISQAGCAKACDCRSVSRAAEHTSTRANWRLQSAWT